MSTSSYSNNSNITIRDNTSANPYPSTITVSQDGVIDNVTVTLTGVNHTYPEDLDILLVGPQGQSVILMSDVGGENDFNGTTLTFSDSAANSLPDSAAISSGTYKPTNIGTGDSFSSPAPASSYGSTLSVFNGTSANGDWKLFVMDDQTTDIGNIAQGWSLNLSVTQVNTAPVLNAGNVANFSAITEDPSSNPGNSVSSLLGSAYSDADNNPAGIAVTSTNNTSDGTWQFSTNSGSSWCNFGTVSATQATLLDSSALIRFVPNANYNGTASITYRAWDGTSGTNGTTGVNVTTNGGSTAFSTATATSSLTITPVNDAPTVTNFAKSVVGNQTLTFASADFTTAYSDVESDPMGTIKITSLPTNGVLSLNNTAITINLEIPSANLNSITYKPNTGFVGSDSFAWKASDGTDYSTSAATANITVSAPPNSAPVLDAGSVFNFVGITEDPTSNPGNSVSSLLGSAFSDADNNPAGIAVTSTNNTSDGTWQFSTNSGSSWCNFGTVSATQATLLDSSALIRFVPNANYNGTANITYRAWDSTSGTNGTTGVNVTTNGGSTAFSTATATSSLTISPVNDAPTVTNFAKSVIEGNTLSLASTAFINKYSDVENTPLANIKITTLPTNGVLSLNNTAITINQQIPSANLSAITYKPNAGFSGNDSFAWKASDGTDYSTSAATANITVSASSAVIEVTQTTDDGTGNTLGTLSWAIKTANTQLGADTISLKNNVRMSFGDSLLRMKSLIDSDITFNGNGFTISGDNNNNNQVDIDDRPLLFVKSGNVTMNYPTT